MKINQLDKHRKDKLLKHINIYIYYNILHVIFVTCCQNIRWKIIGSHRTRCSQGSQGSRLLGSDRAPQWEGLIRLIHDLGLTTVYPWYSPGGPDGSWWKLMEVDGLQRWKTELDFSGRWNPFHTLSCLRSWMSRSRDGNGTVKAYTEEWPHNGNHTENYWCWTFK